MLHNLIDNSQVLIIATDWALSNEMNDESAPELNTVEPVLKDHPIGHKNVVSGDRFSYIGM